MKLPHRPLVAALVLGAIAIGALLWSGAPAASPAPVAGDRLPSFTLTRSDGRTITAQDLLGRPTLLYFGYTFCPDVCPTELGWIARVLRTLDGDAARVNVLFVSVDPPRDTPQVLAEYAPLFHPGIQAATGTPEAVAAFAAALGVAFRRSEVATADPGYYLIDHSSTVFLFAKDGALVGRLGSTMRVDVTAALVRRQF